MAKKRLEWFLDEFVADRRKADPKFKKLFDRLDKAEKAALAESARTVAELVKLRKRRKMSQKELAEALGVSQPYIAKVERGVEPVGVRFIAAYALAVGGRLTIVAERRPRYGA